MNEKIAHGMGQMCAQSISIMVSSRKRCNAGCRYCISRITPGVPACKNIGRIELCDENRLAVGLNYAQRLGATHTILTGKADPTQEELTYICRLILLARQYLPLVDMHTNGVLLLPGMKHEYDLLEELVKAGLTMITFSIASFDDETNKNLMQVKQSAAELIPKARELGLLVRCSLVVNKQGPCTFANIMDYIMAAGELGAHMVVIREVWRPDVYAEYDNKVYQWNQKNWVDIGAIQDQFRVKAADKGHQFLQERDPLPWGTPVFCVGGIFKDKQHGVNVTFARCDEATTGTVIKSIVHKPDGHGFRHWDHDGDILY